MPLIKVLNHPLVSPATREGLRDDLRRATLGVTELGLIKEAQVTVCFLGDPEARDYGPGQCTVIEVAGLSRDPRRTNAVRHALATALATAAHRSVGAVEVFVYSFDPEFDAFAEHR